MFTLITEKSRYFKVKRGQSAAEIEKILNTPVIGRVFEGRIIKVSDEPLIRVCVGVGDSYATVAKRYGVDEERLRQINASRPVYPTAKIFVPKI